MCVLFECVFSSSVCFCSCAAIHFMRMMFEAVIATLLSLGATFLKFPGHVPILTIGLLVRTMHAYNIWYAKRGEDQLGIVFPAISELGVEGQGKRIYQIGFVCVGHFCVFTFIIFPLYFRENLFEGDMDTSKLQTQMIRYGYQAAIGCSIQGLFTLQHNVSLQSIIHWIAAALFMHGSINHAHTSDELYMNTNISLPLWISRAARFRGLILEVQYNSHVSAYFTFKSLVL